MDSYAKLIDLSQSVQRIQNSSFRIQLESINSLIHLSRNEEIASGFSAVSKDLMDFSKQMQTFTNEISALLHSLLQTTTQAYKAQRLTRLLQKAGQASSFSLKELEMIQIKRRIKKSIELCLKLCKRGNVVVVCSKIEASYMSSNASIYTKLAEDVGVALDVISSEFLKIRTNLESNHEKI